MPTAVTQLVRLGGSEYKGVILWSLTWLYISLDADLMSCGGGWDKAFSFAVCVRCVMSTPFLQLKEKKFQQKKKTDGRCTSDSSFQNNTIHLAEQAFYIPI